MPVCVGLQCMPPDRKLLQKLNSRGAFKLCVIRTEQGPRVNALPVPCVASCAALGPGFRFRFMIRLVQNRARASKRCPSSRSFSRNARAWV